eukprot:278094-Pleurochrysis_carterae.AAC.1
MRELLKLEKARLAWALPAGGLRVAAAAATTTGRLDAARHLKPLDLSVMPASHGGHALLGANGSGKSMLAEALLSREGGPSVVQVHQSLATSSFALVIALACLAFSLMWAA